MDYQGRRHGGKGQGHRNQGKIRSGAGSLYGQLPPLVNATSPQGEWNSYDIFFEPPVYEGETVKTPTKVTIIHNGVVVQHGEYCTGPSGHKKIGKYPAKHPETGPIKLQWHGDPIEFKNV
ncbi:MAG: DUF1080 domain-containing protein [Verrucomicrobia bacterium]|jgi:hypothetical protein|nr:DUF1080 domain-containing protein [Verrucomicrobiota bacterium]|tara:strand:- start:26105 stop:26464 length:360 start_codon:yes stop_codon:yes gene_type:complete